MKKLLAIALTVSALASIASGANAAHRRHVQVCSIHHHHRVCNWTWR